ncbi:MAG: 16S rRNA (guanine(966)-N(2))-methyltransferase RsmD [Acidobacteria bacterium]|nr:MAG: 16S rRNA (guanine(966)-N(2))-methyltransferase RsmD [Acidobacteriota bacterium]
MRFTGGEARGRGIKGPRGGGLRPTSDRVREAIFDILGKRVPGARFLDAFAGTGAVGLEALSRGASRTVFLERDRRALRLIRENLGLAPWTGSFAIIEGDALGALEGLARRDERFDIAFFDPPYDHPSPAELLSAGAALLAPAGILIVEHRSSTSIAAPAGTPLRPLRAYRHGDTTLSTFAPTGAA